MQIWTGILSSVPSSAQLDRVVRLERQRSGRKDQGHRKPAMLEMGWREGDIGISLRGTPCKDEGSEMRESLGEFTGRT